jgi:hypothetical protein
MNYTLTYSEAVQGFPSFYSYYPDWMMGMNNYFYTFKGGDLYRHNVNPLRNTFYEDYFVKIGQPSESFHPSVMKSVFNDAPLENKLFKTINIEGDAAWGATLETDIQTTGFINSSWFEKKEGAWFAFVRNEGTTPASPDEYPLRSMNGIGRSITVTGPANALEVAYQISPEPVSIGSIVSIGDYLYYSLPPSYSSPVLCGEITNIVVNYPAGDNYLIVDSTILGGNIPPIGTPYTLYIKNSVAESHGVLGHYCEFTLENYDTNKIELFALESSVMKSYP